MTKKISLIAAIVIAMVCLAFSISVYAADVPANDSSTATASLSTTATYYNGKVKTPRVTAKDNETGAVLKEGTDYTVTMDENRTAVGRYAVYVNYLGKYSGKQTLYFNVMPKGVSSSSVSSRVAGFTVNWSTQKTATTGYEIQYATRFDMSNAKSEYMPKNTYSARRVTGRAGNTTYYVRVRTYTVTEFNGKEYKIYSPWCARKAVKTIAPRKANASISFTSVYYNGKVQTPTVTVKDTANGKKLKKGTDYTVTMSSGRKNIGRYTVTINYKGKYVGSKKFYFNIVPKGVSVKKVSSRVNGFTVQWPTQKTGTTGYQIQFATRKNMSNAKSELMPKNTYSARKITGRAGNTVYYVRIRTYTVTKFNGKNYNIYSPWSAVKSVKTTAIKTYVTLSSTQYAYDAKVKTPSVTVKDEYGDTLVKGTDYTVSYTAGRKNPGVYRVKVSFNWPYCGSTTKTFVIRPGQTTGFKATASAANSITLKWNKINNVSGYQIVKYNPSTGKYSQIKRTSGSATSCTVTGLTASTAYHFKVRAFISNGGTNYYGVYSADTAYATTPVRITTTSVTKSGSTITVKWKTTKSSGYQIFYSTDKNFKKAYKCITLSGASRSSYKITNVDKNATYYVKVRAYINYKGVAHKGVCSAPRATQFSNLYATYTSSYVNNANRTRNLQIASNAISGTIIEPGETFSFNKIVGPRTTAKGYKAAAIFSGGGVENGIGGGVCQVSSTIFNCALRANVGIVERHQHSQRVTYVPLGMDAAIYGTAQDFRWKNITNYSIKIVMTVKNGKITCSFYTGENVKPAKVSLKVSKSGNNFTLKRTVGGKVNYTCKSRY